MIFTPADKNMNNLREYVPKEEISFLKRRFVRLSADVVLAPIEIQSMLKALCFRPIDSPVAENVLITTALNNYIYEAFQHGKPTFDEAVILCNDVIVEFELESWMDRPFHTYKELCEKFFKV
jgi:hypothetical protein